MPPPELTGYCYHCGEYGKLDSSLAWCRKCISIYWKKGITP